MRPLSSLRSIRGVDHILHFVSDILGRAAEKGLAVREPWSRNTGAKFYVQDRMRAVGRDLWSWLADGAHVYVCGDPKRMAKDVERALVDIVSQHGARSIDEAVSFIAGLKKKGRHHQDVY